jgi:hypothetical protein
MYVPRSSLKHWPVGLAAFQATPAFLGAHCWSMAFGTAFAQFQHQKLLESLWFASSKCMFWVRSVDAYYYYYGCYRGFYYRKFLEKVRRQNIPNHRWYCYQ